MIEENLRLFMVNAHLGLPFIVAIAFAVALVYLVISRIRNRVTVGQSLKVSAIVCAAQVSIPFLILLVIAGTIYSPDWGDWAVAAIIVFYLPGFAAILLPLPLIALVGWCTKRDVKERGKRWDNS